MSDTPELPNLDARLQSVLGADAMSPADPPAPAAVWEGIKIEARTRTSVNRRRGMVLRAAAAIVVLVGAVTVVRLAGTNAPSDVVGHGAKGGGSASPAVAPSPTIVTDQLRSWDSARTSADGRQLVLVYTSSTSPDASPSGPCWKGVVATVAPTADEVAVSLRTTQATDFAQDATERTFCTAPGFSHVVTVDLAEPLGTRLLVDASTGEERDVFDGARLLEPQELPMGWQRTSQSGANRSEPGDTRRWSVNYGPVPPGSVLSEAVTVEQSYPATTLALRDATDTDVSGLTVHGLPGELSRIAYDQGWRLQWVEDGGLVHLRGGVSFSREELLRFAEGLKRPTPPGTNPVPGTAPGTAPPGPIVDTPVAIEAAYTSGDVLTLVFSGPANARIAACSGVFVAEMEDSTGVLRISLSSRSAASGSEHELRGDCPKPGFTSSVAIDVRTSMVGRSLVDGVSGETVPIYDGSTLFAATAPSGPPLIRELGAIGTSADFWMRMYGSDPSVPIVVFEVRQSVLSMPDLLVDTPVTGTATVHGQSADLLQDPISMQRSIRWQEGDRRISVTSAPSPQHPDGLTDAELLVIAEGLRVPTP